MGLDPAERFETATVRKVGAQQDELRRRSGRQPHRLGAGPGFDDSIAGLPQNTAFNVESDFAAIHVKNSDPRIIHGVLFLLIMRGVVLSGRRLSVRLPDARFAREDRRPTHKPRFYITGESVVGDFGPYAPRSLFKPAGCEYEFSLSSFLSGHIAGHFPGNVIRLV